MARKSEITPKVVEDFIADVFGIKMHLKRVKSLSNATLGVINSLSLAIHMIGQGLAQSNDHAKKHCVKQVDRLLSNPKLDVWAYFSEWVPYIIGDRKEALIAMDWTEFDSDNHSTIMLSMTTSHGRSTPLVWMTVPKNELKGKRNQYENQVLLRLRECVPENVKVTILADRGFGDTKLFEFLKEELGFDYIIRLKSNIWITGKDGNQKRAESWVVKGGRVKTLNNAFVTEDDYEVEKVVFVKKPKMKEAWILAVSDKIISGPVAVQYYAKRWGIESSFRDYKDDKYGIGMSRMHTKSTKRRDRLFLVGALAVSLLTILGAAGDAIGLERYIKVNTSKKRTYSFFRQGGMYYSLAGSISEINYAKLLRKFYDLLCKHQAMKTALAIV